MILRVLAVLVALVEIAGAAVFFYLNGLWAPLVALAFCLVCSLTVAVLVRRRARRAIPPQAAGFVERETVSW